MPALALLCTACVLGLEFLGVLRPLERFLYDARVRNCQTHLRPPTTRLVHLHIDDAALREMAPDTGDWPWSRHELAAMLDELALARPRIVLLDVFFAERQRVAATQPAPCDSDAAPAIPATQPDLALAHAMKRLREGGTGVILPVPVILEQPDRAELDRFDALVQTWMRIYGRPAQTESAVDATLLEALQAHPAPAEGYQRYLETHRRAALDQAFFNLLRQDPATPPPPVGSAHHEVFRQQQQVKLAHDLIVRDHAWQRRDVPGAERSLDPLLLPLPCLGKQAAGIALANTLKDGGKVTRSMPLAARVDRDRFLPHAALLLAMRLLDADPASLALSQSELSFKRRDGSVVLIPVRTDSTGVEYVADIPWFGTADWATLYDHPGHAVPTNQRSITMLWRLVREDRRLTRNLHAAWRDLPEDVRGPFDALSPTPGQLADAERTLTQRLQVAREEAAALKKEPGDAARQQLRAFEAQADAQTAQLTEIRKSRQLIARWREELKALAADKAVLIGFAATGVAGADTHATPIHGDNCPGIIGISTMASGILSGELWRRSPVWADVLITLIVAALVLLLMVRLRPVAALSATVAILILYAAINGYLLFDRLDLIVPMAPPLLAGALVALSLLVARLLEEMFQRRRVEVILRNYRPKPLVDYLLAHPTLTRLEGRHQEVTIVFTDLADFSGLTRQFEETPDRLMTLLNDYLSRMVPIIDGHGGCVDKFMGDGILFFFNAPEAVPDHAGKAVEAVLAMHSALEEFNAESDEVPDLRMRAGIATGKVFVGDAGPSGACAYTVLGDSANLVHRLQNANKVFGSQTLLNDETRLQLGGGYLLRKLGRWRPPGWDQSIRVYEPLAPAEGASDDHRELARLSDQIVEAFAKADFRAALDLIDRLEELAGVKRFTQLYRRLCEGYLRQPPGPGFDGSIDPDAPGAH